MPSNTARPLRLLSVASHPPSRPASSAEFGSFLAIYDALVVRFGVAADERFTAVSNSITKARQRYNAAYRTCPRTEAEAKAARAGRAAYMRGTGRGRSDPAQEAKAEVSVSWVTALCRHGRSRPDGRPAHGQGAGPHRPGHRA